MGNAIQHDIQYNALQSMWYNAVHDTMIKHTLHPKCIFVQLYAHIVLYFLLCCTPTLYCIFVLLYTHIIVFLFCLRPHWTVFFVLLYTHSVPYFLFFCTPTLYYSVGVQQEKNAFKAV